MGSFGVDLPEGFRYADDFITRDEESALIGHIGLVELSDFELRGVVARRRVALAVRELRYSITFRTLRG